MGIALVAFAVWYWAMWKIILPFVFQYKLVPVKETLSDGTVLTVVRPSYWFHICVFLTSMMQYDHKKLE